MHDWQSLAHVRWECKYHVVIIPKFRRKILYGELRRQVGRILRELCEQRGVELLEGKAMSDHVHLCLSIPPKFSVAHTIGFLKGKSAVHIHRRLLHERRMTGLHFWSTGYCVSTVGLDEGRIRDYIREQEQLEAGQGDLDGPTRVVPPWSLHSPVVGCGRRWQRHCSAVFQSFRFSAASPCAFWPFRHAQQYASFCRLRPLSTGYHRVSRLSIGCPG